MLRIRAQDAFVRLLRKVLQAEGSCLACTTSAAMAQADELVAIRVHALSDGCRPARFRFVGAHIPFIPLAYTPGLTLSFGHISFPCLWGVHHVRLTRVAFGTVDNPFVPAVISPTLFSLSPTDLLLSRPGGVASRRL